MQLEAEPTTKWTRSPTTRFSHKSSLTSYLISFASSWPIRTISFSFDGEFIASASEDLAIDIVSSSILPPIDSFLHFTSTQLYSKLYSKLTLFFVKFNEFFHIVVGGVGRDGTQDRVLCGHEYSCMASQQIPARLCRRRTGIPSRWRRLCYGRQPPCLWLQWIILICPQPLFPQHSRQEGSTS